MQWADSMFLAFIKEECDAVSKQNQMVSMNVVFFISADNNEINQNILVTFQYVYGQVTPYLMLGGNLPNTQHTIIFSGTPAMWHQAAELGNPKPLRCRASIPKDYFTNIKWAIADSILTNGNRAAERCARGDHPTINAENSIKSGECPPIRPAIEMVAQMEEFRFESPGMDPIDRKGARLLYYQQELTILRNFEPKKLRKYWKHVKSLPDKRKYKKEMNPLNLPIQIFADPDLKKELLVFKKRSTDKEKVFTHVEDYLEKKVLKINLESRITEPSTVLEFPIVVQSAEMTCRLVFTAPIHANPADSYATQLLILDKLDQIKDFKVFIGNIEVFDRQKLSEKLAEEQLKNLRKSGYKRLKRFWRLVDQIDSIEEFKVGTTNFGLIFPLIADPNLKEELMGLQGQSSDPLDEYHLLEDFLEQKIKIA